MSSRWFGIGSLAVLAILVGGWTWWPWQVACVQTPVGERSAGDKIHAALARELDAAGGAVKVWVFFTDKGVGAVETAAAVERVAAEYCPRAAQRRALRGTAARGGALFTERDLPVAERYVAAVRATGARLHVTSRWLNAASVWATRAQVAQVAALPFVEKLQPVARARRVAAAQGADVPAPPHGAPDRAFDLDYGYATPQLTQINLVKLHKAGYTGAGVIVGVLDTGFQRSHLAFHNPDKPLRVVAEWDFVDQDGNTAIEPGDPDAQHRHGTLILGTLAAYMPDALVGGAFDASYILCKTEDTTDEYPAEEDNYVAGLEFIEAHGGDMATASLGYIDWYGQHDLDGLTAITTIAVNAATSLGLHCCNAAGNEGHDTNPNTSHLIAPADAFEVITCGAVTQSGAIASFSSDGPTADGRVKPEVLARGVTTWTVSPSADASYTTADGTSLSTPLVAAAVACLIQAHPTWTPAELRESLLETASDYADESTDPLFVRGYGIVNAYAAGTDCNANGRADALDIRDGLSDDCTGNGVPDECEADCNQNGEADTCDIAAGSSQDCTGNGVPDECEDDCNGNGVSDSCDLGAGTSSDCNGNAVPDECDLAGGTSQDVDGDGVPDDCQADCNGNGVPDVQDLADGTSFDCNDNGVADDCELEQLAALLRQWPAAEGHAVAQDFADVGWDAGSCKAWDDFTLTATAHLGAGRAWFEAQDWSGFADVPFLIEIADRAGGGEAGGRVLLSVTGRGTSGIPEVTWDFGGAELPAGTYWISVQAMGGWFEYGQFWWRRANLAHPAGSEHYIHNPGGGFGHGGECVAASVWYDAAADLAFALHGRVTSDCDGNGVPDECQPVLAPRITQQPEDTWVYAGEPATLSVAGAGAPPLQYRWRLEGQSIPGATSATYTIDAAAREHAGHYTVLVTNSCGSILSSTAVLEVRAERPPDAPSAPQPADGETGVPTTVTFGWAAAERAAVYKFFLAAAGDEALVFKASTQSRAWTEPDLRPGTTYRWQVYARNDGGSTPGPVWTFTTAGEPPVDEPGEPNDSGDEPKDDKPNTVDPNDGGGDDSGQDLPTGSPLCPGTAAALTVVTLAGLLRAGRRR